MHVVGFSCSGIEVGRGEVYRIGLAIASGRILCGTRGRVQFPVMELGIDMRMRMGVGGIDIVARPFLTSMRKKMPGL